MTPVYRRADSLVNGLGLIPCVSGAPNLKPQVETPRELTGNSSSQVHTMFNLTLKPSQEILRKLSCFSCVQVHTPGSHEPFSPVQHCGPGRSQPLPGPANVSTCTNHHGEVYALSTVSGVPVYGRMYAKHAPGPLGKDRASGGPAL